MAVHAKTHINRRDIPFISANYIADSTQTSANPASHKNVWLSVTFHQSRPINQVERRTAESAVQTLEICERSLIAAAQTEPAHFAELYEQNFDRVYAFLARRVGTREEAQDLTAEVFHQALASIKNFKWQGAPFIAWLYGIAANVLSNYWQKQGRNPLPLKADLSQAGDEIERSVVLGQVVESLAPDQRLVVTRRFIEQKSILEIAHELGRSEGAVKQLQLRAIEKLRAKLGSRL